MNPVKLGWCRWCSASGLKRVERLTVNDLRLIQLSCTCDVAHLVNTVPDHQLVGHGGHIRLRITCLPFIT
jgi:hypothetical protein